MNQPIILNMQDLATQALEAEPVAPSFIDNLLSQVFSSTASDDEIDALLVRADQYDGTQPGFADELRLTAAAA